MTITALWLVLMCMWMAWPATPIQERSWYYDTIHRVTESGRWDADYILFTKENWVIHTVASCKWEKPAEKIYSNGVEYIRADMCLYNNQ